MKILILPDLHLPHTNWAGLEQAAAYAKIFKPDIVIQLGDLIDAKAWSRFGKDVDDDSPQAEWDAVERDVKRLAKLFPKMTILSGNHDRRTAAKACEASLPRQLVKSLEEAFGVKGWTWHMSSKPLVVDGIVLVHGDEMAGTPGQKAAKLGKSVVQGHTHKASLTYINTFQHQLFGMEAGCLIDAESIAFRYSARNPMTCFQGFAVIDNGLPVLVPVGAQHD